MTPFDPMGPTPLADHLSTREREVIGLIARGLSNQEIATMTEVSINSIKSFIRSAYQKIGVERRPQAIDWALQHGLGGDGLADDTAEAG